MTGQFIQKPEKQAIQTDMFCPDSHNWGEGGGANMTGDTWW